MKTYKQADLQSQKIKSLVNLAAKKWENECLKFVEANGDEQGSCVSGAGIVLNCIPIGKKKARPLYVLRPPQVSQRSLVWENSVDSIIKYLKKNGLECYYMPGRLD